MKSHPVFDRNNRLTRIACSILYQWIQTQINLSSRRRLTDAAGLPL